MSKVNQTKPTKNENIITQTVINNSNKTIASLKKRVLAFVIDYLLVIFLTGLLPIKFTSTSINFMLLSFNPILIVYFIVLEGLVSQTFGKMLINIKVVDLNGKNITFITSFTRNMLRIVDGLLVYLVAIIAIQNSSLGQRIGDKIAKTIVVES